MITDQTRTDPPDTDDTKGLTRLVQFEDYASAIDGLFQQALMATGAGAFDRLDRLGRACSDGSRPTERAASL
ncbi:MAG: hypothetical protein EOM91_19730 [Sphingobacteriia bacterium]|nr:hypothetical protein [Sphingobacteriia bacterium]NCC41413.1 hypothetical protein [Gammaproteobacteria bacterium]